MRRNRRVTALGLTATAAMVAALVLPSGAATAKPGDDGSPKVAKGKSGDIRSVGPDYNHGKKLPLDKKSPGAAKAQVAAANARQANGDHEVGDQLRWLALNDVTGAIYFKTYTLRGLGDHIQVWVADDRAFPAGDCRNALGLTDITDAAGEQLHRTSSTRTSTRRSRQSFSTPPSKTVRLRPRRHPRRPGLCKVSRGPGRRHRHAGRQRQGRELLRPVDSGRPDLHRRLLLLGLQRLRRTAT